MSGAIQSPHEDKSVRIYSWIDEVCDGEREVADFVVILSHLVNNDGKIGTGASLGRQRRGWVRRIKRPVWTC